ncbi:MAG: DUF3857 domain-containing protein [Acidobacteriota bacterium]
MQRAVALGLCVATLAVLGATAARAQAASSPRSIAASSPESAPWLAGAFVAEPTALVAAADALAPVSPGPTAPVVVLFEDVTYRFTADGRALYRRHWVYRILESGALADWGVVQARWSPWAQEPPTLRARVVDAAGREYVLDPARLSRRHAPEDEEGREGDRRLVEARLDGLGVGAIVEETVEIRDHRATFAAGLFARHYLVKRVPVRHARLTLEAPLRLPLRYGVRRAPGLAPRREVGDDTVRLHFVARDIAAAPPAEEGVPAHRPLYPHVAFSTGWSWAHVASAEAVRLDAALAGARLPGLPTAADLAGASPREAARAVVAAVRAAVRYDGLDVLATEPAPPPPDTVLARGRGDSLGLATVAVAGLRRVGVTAHLAWIHAGFGRDVEPRLPGLGGFQHALVWVDPGDGTALWIDPSHPFAAVGSLPLRAQGRFVLVAAAGDAAPDELERTPTSRPEDNLALEQRLVELADFGPGRLVETSIYRGSAARTQRGVTAGLELAERRRGYRAYAQTFHRAADIGALDESPPRALDEPFRLRLEILDSERATTRIDTAVVEVPVAEIARRLPPVFFAPPAERREEFVFHEPFVNRWVYRVTPPPGFRAELAAPRDEIVALGPGRFRQSVSLDETGALIAELELDVGQRLLTASQLETMVGAVRQLLDRPPLELRFRVEALDEFDGARADRAILGLLDAVRAGPDRPVRRLRLARGLLRAGQVDEARRQAELAVDLAPSWAPAYAVLGESLLCGVGGVWAGPGADLEGARAALREAVRLEPEAESHRLELARAQLAALEIGAVGARAYDGEQIDEALATLRAARRDLGSAAAAAAEARLLLRLGRDREALDLAALVEDPVLAAALRQAAGPGGAASATADAALGTELLAELLATRRYAEAAAVVPATAAPSSLRTLLAALRRHEGLEGLADDPRTPVAGLLADLLRRGASRGELGRWLHPRLLAGVDQGSLEPLRRVLEPVADEAAASLETVLGAPLPALVRIDLALLALDPELDGAPHLGYRVTPRTAAEGRLFLTLFDQVPKVVAAGSSPAALGLEAQERLQQGDLLGARQWLAWAAEELAAHDADHDVLRVWRAIDEPDRLPAARLRVVAALLAWPLDRSGAAAATLQAEARRLDARPADAAADDDAPWSGESVITAARRADEALRTPATTPDGSAAGVAARDLRALVAAAGEHPPDELAARADEALARAWRRAPELLRAAAAVHAVARRPLRARALLDEAIVRADPAAPSAGDYVVVGKIAETIGLRLLADAAYQQVPQDSVGAGDSWSALARIDESSP